MEHIGTVSHQVEQRTPQPNRRRMRGKQNVRKLRDKLNLSSIKEGKPPIDSDANHCLVDPKGRHAVAWAEHIHLKSTSTREQILYAMRDVYVAQWMKENARGPKVTWYEHRTLARQRFARAEQSVKQIIAEVIQQHSMKKIPNSVAEQMDDIANRRPRTGHGQNALVARFFKGTGVMLTYHGKWGVFKESEVSADFKQHKPSLQEMSARVAETKKFKAIDNDFELFIQRKQDSMKLSGYTVGFELCPESYNDHDVIRLHLHVWIEKTKVLEIKTPEHMLFKGSAPFFSRNAAFRSVA